MILFEWFSNTVQFQADDMQEKVLHYTWPLTTNHWKPRVRKKKVFCYFYYYALRDARCDFWVSVTSFWGALFILWKKFQASYFSFFFSCSLSPLWQKTEKSLLHIQSSLSSWTSKKSGKQSRIESCSIIKVQLYITVPVSVEYMLTSPAPFQKVRIFYDFDAGILK